MEVIPAIDIMKGGVVRLIQGDPQSCIAYDSFGDPITVAKKWEREGAPRLHIVDLDAALGLGSNLDAIKGAVRAVHIPVQVGGGIRSVKDASSILRMGIDRVILGSLAFREFSAIGILINEFGKDRIIVALDSLNGHAMYEGWATSAGMTVIDAMSRFLEVGVELFLVTSVKRDGTMTGPDLESLEQIQNPRARIIAGGGVRSLEDIASLKHVGADGIVVGRALYEGALRLCDALRAANEP